MKNKDYSDKAYSIARITKLMGHPARVQLLEVLINKGYCKSEDMINGYPIAFTSVSQHLKEFREMGLVYKKYSDDGIAYHLNQEKFNAMKNQIIDFLTAK